MGNTITLNEDKKFVEMVFEGDQTKEMLQQAIRQSLELNSEMSTRYGTVRGLADVSQMGVFVEDSQAAAVSGLRVVSIDKLAIVGTTEKNKGQISAIVGDSGKQALVRIFPDRASAEAWLQE